MTRSLTEKVAMLLYEHREAPALVPWSALDARSKNHYLKEAEHQIRLIRLVTGEDN